MPRKNRRVNMDRNCRFRISVELCVDSKQALELLEAGFARSDGEPGLSAIVRAALVYFWSTQGWRDVKLEKPSSRDRNPKVQHNALNQP